MNEFTVTQSLITQAPGIAGVIVVVILFLRAITARDSIFVSQMTAITERLTALEILIADQDATTKADRERRADTLERIERLIRTQQNQALKSSGRKRDEVSGL